ncbi:PREDICTED: seminal plasma protein pB1-like [Ceratotherium simum simum]|uniref:Seminal plasma protein pB1-like n=1 Tax=Ceratotherium simum simum TaxID=73337 RepID=A0ABM0I4L0_CERSS|nr:PREDICTED: seminal plasma protein pB1-like [Ceratotherium simum simum]
MAPRLGIFLIWAGACVFLQLDHVDGDPEELMNRMSLLFADNKCVFSFTYEGKWCFDCTKVDSLYYWCSLTENFSVRWKDCVEEDYVQCVFPFIYCGQTYDNCTTTGSVFGMPWCSVTPNYDEDGSWKYC